MDEETLRRRREQIRLRTGPNSTPPPPAVAKKCVYRSAEPIHPREAPGSIRVYYRCEEPSQPLGPAVCACKGCGPKCHGYSTAMLFNIWEYGVTTVPERRKTYLPQTLASLAAAGFDRPRLFVDGDDDTLSWKREFNLEVSTRFPRVKTRANWMMSITELYFRNRRANMFALFQDDVIVASDLMKYLDACKLPPDGYFNLYTMPFPHQAEVPKVHGWHKSNQKGRGAIALVFTRDAVMTLLTQKHMVDNFQDAHRGDRNVDGGISDAFKKANWYEYVHYPSLAQHIGDETSMGSRKHPKAETFTGRVS